MRKDVGFLLTAAGALLVWLLKERAHRTKVHRRAITLVVKDRECNIENEPADVRIRRNEQLHWMITNATDDDSVCDPDRGVEVCIRWQAQNPLVDQEGGRFCRTVRPGQTKTLPARVKSGIADGSYYYDVLIDGRKAEDPMVEVVI